MKLSTQGRYGVEKVDPSILALHADGGPVRLGDIAERQCIAVKYLEQIIIPLKKANYISSVRGPKGGHLRPSLPKRLR